MDELEQLRRENEALKLAHQAQQEINQYKQFFLARIAHELRSPLSSVISLQELILQGFCESPVEEKEFLEDAQTAAHRLLEMIDDLVTIAKIDYGKESLVFAPIELTSLWEELHSQIRLPVANKNLRLQIQSQEEEIWINGDRQKLLWVLRNLIDTYLQHTKAKTGEIVLESQASLSSHRVILALHFPWAGEIWSQASTMDIGSEFLRSATNGNIRPINFSASTRWQLCSTLLGKMAGTVTFKSLNPDRSTVELTLAKVMGEP